MKFEHLKFKLKFKHSLTFSLIPGNSIDGVFGRYWEEGEIKVGEKRSRILVRDL